MSCPASTSNSNGQTTYASLDDPEVTLYARSKVQTGWQEKMPVGIGFVNMGNTCYVNATLQTLLHIPAFVNWLLSDNEHRNMCRNKNNNQQQSSCTICPMATIVYESYFRSQEPIRPAVIFSKMHLIGKNFINGRQEDAHEFFRLLLESMEFSYLNVANGHKLDSRSKETTPVTQIFGGYYRDEVTCLNCKTVSTTFHPQAELQLDIRNVKSIEEGITLHFRREQLETNDYRCEKCGTMELTTKQHFLETPPIVLCVQLKRFRQHGTKITKPVHINKSLSLKPYIHSSSKYRQTDASYHLVGLISHIGSSQNCGHYTAIAEAQNGLFYHFDDAYVSLTNLTNTANSDAYVLVYEMNNPTGPGEMPNAMRTSNIISSREVVASAYTRRSTSRRGRRLTPPGENVDRELLAETVKNMTVDEIIDRYCRRRIALNPTALSIKAPESTEVIDTSQSTSKASPSNKRRRGDKGKYKKNEAEQKTNKEENKTFDSEGAGPSTRQGLKKRKK